MAVSKDRLMQFVGKFVGDLGATMVGWSVVLSLLITVPFMLLVGVAMERGLIRHFYKRPHADQIGETRRRSVRGVERESEGPVEPRHVGEPRIVAIGRLAR